jgi:hypothetical protein
VPFVSTTNNPFSADTLGQLRQLGACVSNLWRVADTAKIDILTGDMEGAYSGAAAVELKNYSSAFDATNLSAAMTRAAEKVAMGVKVVLLVTNRAPGAWKDGGLTVNFFNPTGVMHTNYSKIKALALQGVVPALLVKKDAGAFLVHLLFPKLFNAQAVVKLVVLVVPTLDLGLSEICVRESSDGNERGAEEA